MRIIVITEYLASDGEPFFGGVDSRTLNLVKRIKGHEIHIICSKNLTTDEEEERYQWGTIHRVGQVRAFTQRGSLLERLKFIKNCKEKALELNPTIVEASGFVAFGAAQDVSQRLHIPCLASVHEIWKNQWIDRMGFANGIVGEILERRYFRKGFDRYVAVSEATKTRIILEYGVPSPIDVVPNGIDTCQIHGIGEITKRPNPTAIVACRLVSYKRVHILIQAMSLIISRQPNVRLVVVGEGPEKTNLINLTKKLGISNNVVFIPKFCRVEDLYRTLKSCDLFCFPSKTEGFGIALVEAMALGLPYVASDIPALREVTDGGIGGRLIKSCSPIEWSEAIKSQLASPPSREEMRKSQSRAFIYDWEQQAKKMSRSYEEIVK